jgi:hypothetical protein
MRKFDIFYVQCGREFLLQLRLKSIVNEAAKHR